MNIQLYPIADTLDRDISDNSARLRHRAPLRHRHHRSPEMKRQAAIAYAAALEVLG